MILQFFLSQTLWTLNFASNLSRRGNFNYGSEWTTSECEIINFRKHDNSKMAKCIAGEGTIKKNWFLQVYHRKYCLEVLDIHAVIFYTEAPEK